MLLHVAAGAHVFPDEVQNNPLSLVQVAVPQLQAAAFAVDPSVLLQVDNLMQIPVVALSPNPILQDLTTEFPGQVHVTAAFAIGSQAVHTNVTGVVVKSDLEPASKPSLQTAMV